MLTYQQAKNSTRFHYASNRMPCSMAAETNDGYGPRYYLKRSFDGGFYNWTLRLDRYRKREGKPDFPTGDTGRVSVALGTANGQAEAYHAEEECPFGHVSTG